MATSRATVERSTADDGYTIRWFEPGDREGFMALHDRIWPGFSTAWFDWKFADNPYLTESPVVVAERDGEIVGARPNLAFQMRAGDTYHTAIQSCDTMVHEDHRRQGLFSRMSERLFEGYADGPPAFTFNVPNSKTTAGLAKLGCEIAGEHTTYYRVQDPAVYAGVDDRLLSTAGKLAARGYLGARGRRVDRPPEVSVTRHTDIPAQTLARLYRRRPPAEIHAYRDEQFFEYRFGNPQWEYTAYTARLGGDPVAGLVTGTQETDTGPVTNVADVVPLVGDVERDRALPALLARALADHRDSAVVAVRGDSIPRDLLADFGFHSDHRLPLRLLATPTTMIVSPIPPDGDWRVAGRDLRELDNWRPTFVEHNTA
ncbi:GNAT family N-acetyltransferase [Halomicroarcula limicola]|uniref:GNAT family N-acetyltransferase n=1 Tax=Haloarcula limicola TaxID=1429915 RepID=A0A8J8C5P2_9EURY|nr:GNAT family N-acetyltransferase [Halomicroarcula limicola]MBV0925409.1 GNAT family N-acetyltransferase [Halomicroarcula limicola]